MSNKEIISTYLFDKSNIANVTKTSNPISILKIQEFPKKGIKIWYADNHNEWISFEDLKEQGYDKDNWRTLREFYCYQNNIIYDYSKPLKKLSFDIETKVENINKFDSPDKAENGIFIITVSMQEGNGKVTNLIFHSEDDEKEVINSFINTVQSFRPDIILTYNGNDFDFPYIIKRCEILGIDFKISKAFTKPYINFKSGTELNGEKKKYRNFSTRAKHDHNIIDIDGIINIDLYICAEQNTFLSNESLTLKNVCEIFNVDENWKDFEVGEIFKLYKQPETKQKILDYAQKDSLNTLKLYEHLAIPELKLSEIYGLDFSITYSNGAIVHNNFIIQKLYKLIDKELNKPIVSKIPSTVGGLSKAMRKGIFKSPIYHCDFSSMYPNLIHKLGITSKNDTEKIVPLYLKILFDYRVKNKSNKNMYQTIKILINSVFGCFKDSYGKSIIFDHNASEQTTVSGQLLLAKFIKLMEDNKYTVIEIDTDGIYITDGENKVNPEVLLSNPLKDFMNYDVEKVGNTMICYGAKNYAIK